VEKSSPAHNNIVEELWAGAHILVPVLLATTFSRSGSKTPTDGDKEKRTYFLRTYGIPWSVDLVNTLPLPSGFPSCVA